MTQIHHQANLLEIAATRVVLGDSISHFGDPDVILLVDEVKEEVPGDRGVHCRSGEELRKND